MANQVKIIDCHECGRPMVRGKKLMMFNYKDKTVEIDQTGWLCESCDEMVLEGSDARATDREFAEFRSRIDGVLSPQRVAEIRKMLRLSQRKASAILGGGPRSFQKYESGTALISRAMSNLLLLLEKNPTRLKELTDEAA